MVDTSTAGACEGCERLPSISDDPGVLVLAPALRHTRSVLARRLADVGIAVTRPDERLLRLEVAAHGLTALLQTLDDMLSEPEQRACRALFLAHGHDQGLANLALTRPLNVMVANVQGQWLRQMLGEQRLLVHFQPIVPAAAPTRIFAYECLMRGVDAAGGLVSPENLLPAARAAELLFHLDRAARLAAIESAAEYNVDEPLFINFNPSAIYDPAFCLRPTTRAALASRYPPTHFVFEAIESDRARDERHLKHILDYYRAQGFRVALDDLGAGYGSLNLLADIVPDFVKINRHLVHEIDRDPVRQTILTRLLDMTRSLTIASIAEGVETVAELEWLRAHGVDYVQGFLIGPPSVPPPQPAITETGTRLAAARDDR